MQNVQTYSWKFHACHKINCSKTRLWATQTASMEMPTTALSHPVTISFMPEIPLKYTGSKLLKKTYFRNPNQLNSIFQL